MFPMPVVAGDGEHLSLHGVPRSIGDTAHFLLLDAQRATSAAAHLLLPGAPRATGESVLTPPPGAPRATGACVLTPLPGAPRTSDACVLTPLPGAPRTSDAGVRAPSQGLCTPSLCFLEQGQYPGNLRRAPLAALWRWDAPRVEPRGEPAQGRSAGGPQLGQDGAQVGGHCPGLGGPHGCAGGLGVRLQR